MDGLLKIFNSYVNLLISALPGSVDDEVNLEGLGNKIVRMAETEDQQLALLANASLLAEELLPRAAMKLYSMNPVRKDSLRRRGPENQNRAAEQRAWKRKLNRMVEKLRDSFCRQHALDLIFTEEGDTRLSAEMYIDMDNTVEDPEWVPSPIFQVFPYFLACCDKSPVFSLQNFQKKNSCLLRHLTCSLLQELYAKLNKMASVAADMFVGRERFATLLMMRLTEAVMLWLSDDQSFWEEVEEGPRALGPVGLQQVISF